MWKYDIALSAQQELFAYIKNYKEYFLDTFTDTGLGIAESIIREGYETSSRELFFSITKAIDTLMQQDIIPYGFSRENVRLTTCSVEKRRVFVQYIQDDEVQMRTIMSIKIIRK